MIELSSTESKKREVTAWIKMFRSSPCEVLVSNYAYRCLFSGNPKTKTLIVLPDEIDAKGVISIDKPLEKVDIPDIIKLFKRITL
ncbi:MAG: hypothetical protein AAF693_16030 [Bacteroidota bacterium]